MNTKNISLLRCLSILVAAVLLFLSACTSSVEPGDAQIESASGDVPYQEFTLPFPEEVTFELPEGWEFWGNAGYLSPDDGRIYAGFRQAWIEEGKDAEAALYNEGSVVHEITTVMVGGLETHRMIVEVTLTSASTGEVISHTYEMIYAFPAPNGEMMAGVIFSAPTRDELEQLVPVAEHMVESLKWSIGD